MCMCWYVGTINRVASRRFWNNRPRPTSHAQQSSELQHALLHGCCLHSVLIGGLCDDNISYNDDILDTVW